ncbi:MAG: tetratricopeptide repeat protein [Deltaproteobacteria bacterium]|nr:tetratricopeptide repeat protein [Deltaproteobacteria bacterium]
MLRSLLQLSKLSISAFGLFLLVSCSSKQSSGRSQVMDEKASVQYQFAYQAYEQGSLIPALSACLKAVDLAPKNADARNLLGLIYFRQYKYKEAEETFKQAIEIDSSMSEIHNNLGTLYYEMKRYDDAFASLERALENPLYLYPERIHNNRGLVLQAQQKYALAQTEFERSMTLRPEFYLPYQNLGKLFYEQNEFTRAKPLFKEAGRLCTDCSEPRYYLGSLLLKENKASEALKLFKAGAEMDPRGYYGELCKKYIVQH